MDEKKTKIIRSYKKITDFVFHYLIFFVVIIASALLFQQIISQSATINVFQTNSALLMQKAKLIAGFNKFLKQDIQDDNIEMYILQGDLQIDQGFIKSINNLISYKGFIVPRYFYLYNTLPLKQMSYFSGKNYDTNELENFVNTFVFTKKITVIQPFSRIQLPIAKNILTDFNLACVFGNKISATTCNYYLNDFLDGFFVYNLSLDYNGLKNIFAAIQNKATHKKNFCEGLSKYLLYANDHSETIKELFGKCGQEFEDLFKRTTLFMEIQKGIENQSFEKISYKDISLNAYKVVSYQQQLYQDFLIKKADTYKISVYLDFVKEILKKNTIEPFYKDEIYRFNNKYLAPALEQLTYQSNTFSQNLGGSKISVLLTSIKILNEGEPMLGFAGLNSEITNDTLLVKNESSGGTISSLNTEEKIQKKIKNISYLTIEQQKLSGTTIDIIGQLTFFSSKTIRIKTHVILEYSNDLLLVKSIELEDKSEINEVIKALLRIQKFSIGELYSYISKNLAFYEQENIIPNEEKDFCLLLKADTSLSISSCSPTQIILDKNTLRYTFAIENQKISSVSLSDANKEASLMSVYSTIISKNNTIVQNIQAIVRYEIPAQGHEGTTNSIFVVERIQQYLGIKTNDIADKSGRIVVDISLRGINFIAQYLLETNTLGPWYFKDIIANQKPYQIQNFNLLLDDAHQNSINSFVIDPLTAIKNADSTAWQNYNAAQVKP